MQEVQSHYASELSAETWLRLNLKINCKTFFILKLNCYISYITLKLKTND